jgi:putative protease
VTVRSTAALAPATRHGLGAKRLRQQLGRLGETPFVLGSLDLAGLAEALFLPVSALNDLRQEAVAELLLRRDWQQRARRAAREAAIDEALEVLTAEAQRCGGPQRESVGGTTSIQFSLCDPPGFRASAVKQFADLGPDSDSGFRLTAEVWRLEDAQTAAAAGATEISLDLFLRHPTPPVSRVRALMASLADRGVTLRLRTPTIVRPGERKVLDKWLALGTPIVSGHLGLVAELARAGRDVVADYAVNCFNQHAAAEIFALGARRIVLSVELTGPEMAQVAAPWRGRDFEVFVYGRPEGMTLEHCVLAAAFEREPGTCRDLCVEKHPQVDLTDPTGYAFPVATDSACRNRLLHSRPVDASEYLPELWSSGFRNYRLVFNVPADPVAEVTSVYRRALDALGAGGPPDPRGVRAGTGRDYTRGHFARAV